MDSLLSARALCLHFADRTIFDHLSLELAPSEVVTIEGASGTGKSTLLRILAAQMSPSSGELRYQGASYASMPTRELRRKVALLFQQPLMFDGSVRDNVETGPKLHGRRLTDETVRSLLSSVDLDGFEGREARSLSGGEKQRVALARALANEPTVLLCDEPTSALDGDAATHVLKLLRAVADRGLNVVMVTHSPEHAARVSTRRLTLTTGKLVPRAAT